MTQQMYWGVDGVARHVIKGYYGVDGVAHRIKQIYVGDENGVARLAAITTKVVVTFDANGGEGTMDPMVLESDVFDEYIDWYLPTCSYTKEGKMFGGWGSTADAEVGLHPGQRSSVRGWFNLTYYAIWMDAVYWTVRYQKVYYCDWPLIYPPEDNTGPIYADGQDGPYYLRLTLDGNVLDGMNDKFDTGLSQGGGTLAPAHEVQAMQGSTLAIQLINKYSGDCCEVYVNDVLVAGPLQAVTYSVTVDRPISVKMEWHTDGTIFSNPQSYWICRITM